MTRSRARNEPLYPGHDTGPFDNKTVMRRALTIPMMLSVLPLVAIAAQQVATKPAAQPAPAETATQNADAPPAAPAAPRPMEVTDSRRRPRHAVTLRK